MPTSRRVRIALALLIAAAGITAIVGAGPALVVEVPLDSPDAIVPLASHEWERLPAAAALARRYPGARVILTVPAAPSYWNCFRCGERVEWLAREGVEPSRVVELPGVRNTYTEALAVAAYARGHGVRRVIIVTSPYHTRRALAAFRNVFDGSAVALGVVPAPSSATPETWWRYDVDREYVAYEWAAILVYGVRYGMSPF